MKNIAFVVTKPEIGGAQSWVNEVALLLSGYKDVNLTLVTSSEGWLTESKAFNSIYIIPGINGRGSIKTLIQLYKLFKNRNFDVVISSSANAGFYSRLAKILHSHKSIYVSHGWSCIYNGGRFRKLFCFIEWFLSLFTDHVLCVSECDRYKAINKLKIKESKITVILNAITPLKIREQKKQIGRLLFVGRLSFPKRPDLLLEAVSKLSHIKLDVVGDGEYLSALKMQYRNFKNINFLGEIRQFNRFNEYDAFALISDSEGLPVSAIEASTAALPLILSNVGGCGELINGNGVLVDNNVESITNAVTDIFENYEGYSKIAYNLKDVNNISNRKEEYLKLIFS